ncbi:unnamed protein product [Camellia sinensis]
MWKDSHFSFTAVIQDIQGSDSYQLENKYTGRQQHDHESGFNENTNTVKTSASAQHSPPGMEREKTTKNSSGSIQDLDKIQKEKEVTNTVPLYELFSFADFTDYVLMLVGTMAAIGNGICMPLTSVLLGELIDSFGQTVNTKQVVHQVSKVSLKYVYLALGSGFASFFRERQSARIRSLYLRTILRQEIGYFDKETTIGEIISRMSGDTFLIQDAMGEKVGKFIQLVASFLGGFVLALIKGWLLTLVLLSSVPPIIISTGIMMIIRAKMTSRGQIAYSLAGTVAEQTIGSIRTVASFTGERQAINKYKKSLLKAYKSGVQAGLALGLGTGVFMFLWCSSYALAVWYGAKMIIDKGYTGGRVMIVISAVLTGSFSAGHVSPCLSAFASGQAAAFKMIETINRKSEIDPYDTNGQKLDDICGDIELRDVYFSYPARQNELIFSGFSLSIPRGTTVALVGQSGSGKSTVINLIERFYDPQAGEVLIDGINVKEFQLRWIRGKIGLVSQEPVLFTSSIRDNIAYGKDGATIEEIKVATELANAAKFIDKLPQGLDTMVGEHGIQMSGGQKQRIAIARAILKDPRILLLDEATSALDAESEKIVQEALERVMINRTTIIVAHRLGTVKNADMIAVIHRGKVVEKGLHSELVQDPEGAFCQLLRLQELSKDSEQKNADDWDGPEIIVDSGRHSSQQVSLRSLSQGSSGIGNSSRHSFSISFGVPTAINFLETTTAEPTTPASATLQAVVPQVPLCRLAYLNKPEIPILIIGSAAAVIHGLIMPIFGLLLASIIKIFYKPPPELRKDSKFWASMFLVLGVATLLATPKLVHMETNWFDEAEHSSGKISARLSGDATLVTNLVGDSLALIVQNAATAIAGLVIAFQANWLLALIILVTVPLIGLNGYMQAKFLSGFSADAKKSFEDASQVAGDAVGSIRTIASFSAEEKVMQLYQMKCEGPMKAGIRQGLVCGAGLGFAIFSLFLVYAACFYAGARLVEAGKMDFAAVFRVFFGLTMTTLSISQSVALAPDLSRAKSAAASILAILDQKSKIDSSDDSGTTLENVWGDIEFQHISFKYATRPNIQIFRDLCLTISSNKTVALVGESGCGKSTIISLLQRFYDPNSGQITLDGVEIKRLKLKWLRQQMGLVSQEPVLFNEANISYGKASSATEAEIIAAAELANAHKFISGLQQGYDTVVGERGIQLSGGQKQRVAIARAIVKSPRILLLDEATSALDAESEKEVQDALDRVMVDRTTVVVAHRLSTIIDADLIAVVKNGVIAEKGKHDTLMNINDGIYASLVALHTSASS